jgi:hypothetical protein
LILPGDSAVQQQAQPVIAEVPAVADTQDFLMSKLTASVPLLLMRPAMK